jgi:cytoskeleton protein RodZ
VADGIGDTLKQAREERGRALEDAARDTRVRREHLIALEEERFEALGGDVYAKGFLRTYATWLGLDPEPLVERFRREVAGAGYDAHALLEHPVARPPRRGLPSWVAWTGIGALVLFVALTVAGTLGGRSPEPASGLDPDPVATPAPTAEPSPSPDPTDEPSPEPTPEGVELVLIFEEASWVRVTIDGQVVEEGLIAAGETLTFSDDEGIRVRLGNAGGVVLRLNDQSIGSPAGRGQVWEGMCTLEGCAEA